MAIAANGEDFTSLLKIVVPLQYTGLKDKNGKEIYEGDVLQIELIEVSYPVVSLYEVRCHVIYGTTFTKRKDIKSEDLSFQMSDTIESDHIREEKGVIKISDKWSDGKPWREYKSVEVIGNIYENPELL